MAFKNALKMLVSKFGLMWVILLYLLITGVLVVSLSLPFAVPLVRTFEEAGLPTLVLDGDGCDERNVADGQMVTRLNAFLEQLEGRIRG